MAAANGVRRAEERANFIVQRGLLEVSQHPYFDTEQVSYESIQYVVKEWSV